MEIKMEVMEKNLWFSFLFLCVFEMMLNFELSAS
jgi:hypothetical protein